jgi:hypothetical protein
MADGLLGKCKECTKTDAKDHRESNLESIRAYDRARGNRQSVESLRLWRAKYPNKAKAHNKLNNAVRDGRIERPSKCEDCQRLGAVHGHHDDYLKPLEVRWLCAACHQIWHAINGEAKNG